MNGHRLILQCTNNKIRDGFLLLLAALTYAGNLDNIDPSLKSNGNFQFHHGNITHPDIVSKLVSEANIVVHFAAESHVTRSIYDNAIFFETDVIGTQVVANALTIKFGSLNIFVCQDLRFTGGHYSPV